MNAITPTPITRFSDIRFDSATHTYTHAVTLHDGTRGPTTPLRSVSSIVNSITPAFDRDAVAARVSRRDGMTVAEVLADWDARGEVARDRGNTVDSYIDNYLSGQSDPFIDAINGDTLPEFKAFRDLWGLLQKFGAAVVKRQMLVGDVELGVAGHIDAVVLITFGGVRRLHIIDWKTGKLKDRNQFERLLPPFDDFEASDLAKYSVQASLYRLCIERNTPAVLAGEMEVGDALLGHLRSDGTHYLWKAVDMREKLAAWLPTLRTAGVI